MLINRSSQRNPDGHSTQKQIELHGEWQIGVCLSVGITVKVENDELGEVMTVGFDDMKDFLPNDGELRKYFM